MFICALKFLVNASFIPSVFGGAGKDGFNFALSSPQNNNNNDNNNMVI